MPFEHSKGSELWVQRGTVEITQRAKSTHGYVKNLTRKFPHAARFQQKYKIFFTAYGQFAGRTAIQRFPRALLLFRSRAKIRASADPPARSAIRQRRVTPGDIRRGTVNRFDTRESFDNRAFHRFYYASRDIPVAKCLARTRALEFSSVINIYGPLMYSRTRSHLETFRGPSQMHVRTFLLWREARTCSLSARVEGDEVA